MFKASPTLSFTCHGMKDPAKDKENLKIHDAWNIDRLSCRRQSWHFYYGSYRSNQGYSIEIIRRQTHKWKLLILSLSLDKNEHSWKVIYKCSKEGWLYLLGIYKKLFIHQLLGVSRWPFKAFFNLTILW